MIEVNCHYNQILFQSLRLKRIDIHFCHFNLLLLILENKLKIDVQTTPVNSSVMHLQCLKTKLLPTRLK